ncbi:hypothetical protein Taro_023292 [Colocasia esculenta]|uniref:HIT domain-containing protein n=1 Tax=Colocasia esculenta TaxID=4460 RepID=A0A843V611_COLES|nr:hypothetical protein [Colocasia esculenta]
MAAAAAASPMSLLRLTPILPLSWPAWTGPVVLSEFVRLPLLQLFVSPADPMELRSSRQICSAVDEEAAARAAAASAESGGPTMYLSAPPCPFNNGRDVWWYCKMMVTDSLVYMGQQARGHCLWSLFDKIISREIPSTVVYEDDKVLAFRDINPQAPVHVLLIPKVRDGLTELGKAELKHEDIFGHLLYAAKIVAEKEGIVDGFRVVINSGVSACQSVYHLHLHVLGGRQMKWPPG